MTAELLEPVSAGEPRARRRLAAVRESRERQTAAAAARAPTAACWPRARALWIR